jgi:hypothetical protein
MRKEDLSIYINFGSCQFSLDSTFKGKLIVLLTKNNQCERLIEKESRTGVEDAKR